MAFGRNFAPRGEKKSKYNNKKVVYQGISFDSKKEMERYMYLLDAQKNGVITDLQRQVKFELIPAVREEYIEHLKTKDKVKTRTLQLAITYTCDFYYKKDGELVIEDVKASPKMLPKEYILKKKLLFAIHRISIKEIYKPNQII
jgi:hypothetical protein